MRILVINAGSSSVKAGVFNMQTGEQLFKTQVERATSLEAALETLPQKMAEAGHMQIDAVGHRVAHGGEKFSAPTLLDAAVITDIEACIPLAPLHNPPALTGIRMAMAQWNVPQVAVFDTAFHQTMPASATTYAVPLAWRQTGLRRYGFHGTSHQYIAQHTAQALGKKPEDLKIISCHLGNGASVCAIRHGQSVDTSMGATPLEGLVMGSRSGDVDPGLYSHINRTLGLSIQQIENALYHESGLAALSCAGNDLRDIEAKASAGDKNALLALEIYAYRVKKYIGAYAAALDGAEAVTFTGGIGENSGDMRARICQGLDFMGIILDPQANTALKLQGFEVAPVHAAGSRTQVLVTQTREQWMIARQTHHLLKP